MQETWDRSLGWENLLEKRKATHSSTLAWRIPWTGEVHGVTKRWTRLSEFHFTSRILQGPVGCRDLRRLSGHRMIFFFPQLSIQNLLSRRVMVTTLPPPSTIPFHSWRLSSVQFSHSVMSDSLQPHESQHARPPCPSPTPRVHSDSHPLSQWCHPAISSSVIPFSSCPQSLPASEPFSMSQLFAWGGQSTGVSALASFLPKKSQGWSPSEWTGWISLQSKGLSRVSH